MIRCFLTMSIILCAWSSQLCADNWPRFRGLNGQGVSQDTTIPTQFTKKDYNWRIQLPGGGYGSPAVWGENIFLVCAKQNADRIVACVDAATGKTKWTQTFQSATHRLHKFNHYGACTPAVDASHIYLTWITPQKVSLIAMTHAGKVAWKREDLGGFQSQHGGGTSPLVYKDTVIVTNDQLGPSFLIGLDAATGETRWKIPRKNQGKKTAYAVPCIVQGPDGKDQLICMSKSDGVTGHDPMTGKTLWQLDGVFKLRVVSSPVLVGGLIFGSCGQGGGGTQLVAVKPGDFKGKGAKRAYEITKKIPYVPTSVAYQGKLYVISDGGIMMCLDPATGKSTWSGKRLDGAFFGSPVVVNGFIYIIDKEGVVHVVKADPKSFQYVHKHELGEMSYATPAVSNGKMYLRTKNHLISIGGQ